MTNICDICYDEIGLKWCTCEFYICSECIEKLPKYICSYCRKSLEKKIYFAGKLNKNKFDNFLSGKNILVLDSNNKESAINFLKINNYGNSEICKDDIVLTLNDFLNLEMKMPLINMNRYILTGPYIILNENFFINGNLEDQSSININLNIKILNKRKEEMITNCDIFVLHLNKKMNYLNIIKEWSLALSLDKILVLDINENKEFYSLAEDSLNSFKKIEPYTRDTIIKSIPNFKFTDWISYKKWCNNIILQKN